MEGTSGQYEAGTQIKCYASITVQPLQRITLRRVYFTFWLPKVRFLPSLGRFGRHGCGSLASIPDHHKGRKSGNKPTGKQSSARGPLSRGKASSEVGALRGVHQLVFISHADLPSFLSVEKPGPTVGPRVGSRTCPFTGQVGEAGKKTGIVAVLGKRWKHNTGQLCSSFLLSF